MNRRLFVLLPAIFAGMSGRFRSPSQSTGCLSVTRLLDEFNRKWPVYGDQIIRVGDYEVIFTGLKSSQANTLLVGQWLAWPWSGLSLPDRKALVDEFGLHYIGVPYVEPRRYLAEDTFQLGSGLYLDHLYAPHAFSIISRQVWDVETTFEKYLSHVRP